MWQKVDVSGNPCDEERQFFFKMMEIYKFSCVKILTFWNITERLVFT